MSSQTSKPDGRRRSHDPEISVVICTRDHARQLRVALQSVAEMDVPADLRWEVVVVDNGSTDATPDVVGAFADRLPIRLVREERAGLSHARNCGVREARGAYICWTDDDVIVGRGWLNAYAEAFVRHSEAAFFGGRIIPKPEPPTPAWFTLMADRWPLTTLLAKRDFGDKPVRLDFAKGISPWGANFAVRTAEQRRHLYEPALGVSPNQRRLGEEAEVIFQLTRAGAVGWWAPDAVVEHLIAAHRQTRRYVYDYNVAYGETVAYLERAFPDGHHVSGNRRDINRAKGSALGLRLRAAAHLAGFGFSWALGSKSLALVFLARAGLYAGAARVAASDATIVRRRDEQSGPTGDAVEFA